MSSIDIMQTVATITEAKGEPPSLAASAGRIVRSRTGPNITEAKATATGFFGVSIPKTPGAINLKKAAANLFQPAKRQLLTRYTKKRCRVPVFPPGGKHSAAGIFPPGTIK